MGKTVCITGASSGIGTALAREYARYGYQLILVARRRDRLEALADQLSVPVHIVAADVSSIDDVTTGIETLPDRFRAIDILVNNAGVTIGEGPIHERSLNDWNVMIDTNIRGLVQCTRILLPLMTARGYGHIVNLGSTAGTYPRPGNPIYCASKAFAKQFSLALRADLVGKRIRVTSIEPGTVQDTELVLNRVGGEIQRLREIYAGYEYLTPEDIARTIAWCTEMPDRVNINRVDLMATCQTFSNLSNVKFDDACVA